MITERIMANGDFSITLKPETPASVVLPLVQMDQVSISSAFSQIIVTESWVPPEQVHALMEDALYDYTSQPGTIGPSDDNPLPYDAGPKYTGVLTRVESQMDGSVELSGNGLQSLLGDANRGQFIYRRIPLDDSFPSGVEGSDLFNYTLDGFDVIGSYWDYPPSPLRRRYYFVPSGSTTAPFGEDVSGYIPRLSLLEMIAVTWDLEWVVRHHGRVDMGQPDKLYPEETPVITRLGGDDRTAEGDVVQGLTAADLSVSVSVEDYVSEVILATGEGYRSSGSAAELFDPFGYPLLMAVLEDRTDVSGDTGGAYAIAEQARLNGAQKEIRVSTTTHQGLDRVICGQPVDIYDPAQGLTGTDHTRLHRGDWILPVRTRIVGHTWPVREGMGVYKRRFIGDTPASPLPPIPAAEEYEVIDLTPYVQFEDGSATVAVGVPPKPTFPSTTVPPLLDANDPLASPEGQGHVATQRRLGQTEVATEDLGQAINDAIAADPAGTTPTTLVQLILDVYAHRNDP